MEIHSSLTKQNYVNYCREYCLQYKRTTKLAWSICLTLYFTASVATKYSWPQVLIMFIVSGIVFFSLFFSIPYAILIMRVEKLFGQIETDERTLTIGADGITVERQNDVVVIPMTEIKNAYVTESFISIILYRAMFSKFPKRRLILFKNDLGNAATASQFFNRIGNQAARNKYVDPKKNIPYAWGFMGLIPLVGAVNGIVMVVNGITKFKSTAYVLLGVAGILFTVGVYGSLFYEARYGDVFKGPEIRMTQGELNTLVKSIEFYKLQNNQYPDSLKQVGEKDSMSFIYDTMDQSATFSHKQKLFYYRKIGDKYTLFSSGFDGKPFTADDVYPNLKIVDSSKFGLVRVSR